MTRRVRKSQDVHSNLFQLLYLCKRQKGSPDTKKRSLTYLHTTSPIPFTFEGASPLLCISSPQGRKKQTNLLHKHTPFVSTLKKIEHLGVIYEIHRMPGVNQAVIGEVACPSKFLAKALPIQKKNSKFAAKSGLITIRR